MTAATDGTAAYGTKFTFAPDDTNGADRHRRVTITVDVPAQAPAAGKAVCKVCLKNARKRP